MDAGEIRTKLVVDVDDSALKESQRAMEAMTAVVRRQQKTVNERTEALTAYWLVRNTRPRLRWAVAYPRIAKWFIAFGLIPQGVIQAWAGDFTPRVLVPQQLWSPESASITGVRDWYDDSVFPRDIKVGRHR
jgi:hypothetical protein